MFCQKCGSPISDPIAPTCPACGNPILKAMTSTGASVQSTAAAYLPASAGKRLANLLLDTIGIYILYFVFAVAVAILRLNPLINFFLSLLGNFIYYAVFESLWQRSPAKFITGTKVVALDGSKPSIKSILKRSLIRYVPFEAFSFLSSGNPVGWHDRWADTLVVPANYSPEQMRIIDTSKSSRSAITIIAIIIIGFFVGIAALGILSSVILASLGVARSKGTDATRIADIKSIQLELELYNATNGTYPKTLADLSLANPDQVPMDPVSLTAYDYYSCSPTSYHLGASLAAPNNPMLALAANAGTMCPGDTVAGLTTDKCSPTDSGSYCFDVAEEASSSRATESTSTNGQ